MMHYEIYLEGNKLRCIGFYNNTERRFLDSKHTTEIVHRFSRNELNIVIKDKDIKLKVPGETLIIRDCDTLLEEKFFESLKNNIVRSIHFNGFVDVSKSNYRVQKKNVFSNKVVKKIIITVIAGATIISIAGGAKSTIKETDTPVHTQITMEQTENVDTQIAFSEESTEENIINEENISESIPVVYITRENLSDTEKALETKKNYESTIIKYANMYGLDTDLILAIATQERGTHSTEVDMGGGMGLMQIQYSIWANQTIDGKKFNEANNTFEPVSLTLTDDFLMSVNGNIEAGCIIFQDCLRRANYNILVATQMYNMGPNAVRTIISTYADNTGKTLEQVINDPKDTGWMEYRYLKSGDPKYIENVIKWISDNTFCMVNPDSGENIKLEISNGKSY